LRDAMKAISVDAILVSNPKNVLYLTDIPPMMEGQVMPFTDPEYFVLLQPARLDVLCDGRYIAEIQHKPDITANLLQAPVSARVVGEKIKELLPAGVKTIGYESDAVRHCDAIALMEYLRSYTWKAAEQALADMRVVKSPQEVELIRKAQAITGQAFEHICKVIRVGMTEKEVALEIGNYLRSHSDGNSFNPIVAFGETGAFPHYLPSAERKLQKGHLVLLDFGGIWKGYCGDLTRMLVMGKADARMREVYDLVLTAQQRCLDGIRPGKTGHELDALCRDYFASKDCDAAFVHGTGHGVGLAIHEPPTLKRTFEAKIQPGMVFTVEPGLYYPGWGGVRIEDMVVATEQGCENLTPTSKKLVEIN
jgi:Xaa-Pro aminopeptidase